MFVRLVDRDPLRFGFEHRTQLGYGRIFGFGRTGGGLGQPPPLNSLVMSASTSPIVHRFFNHCIVPKMSTEGSAAMDVDVDAKDEVVVMMLDDKNEDNNEEVEEGGDDDDDDDEQQGDDDDDDDGQSEQSEYSYGDYDSDYEGADLEGQGPSAASRAAAAASQPGASGAKSKGEFGCKFS